MPRTVLGRFGTVLRDGGVVDARNIRGGTITAQELVLAGGTQGVIRSQNFSITNETGWAAYGDGSAYFYGDLTIGANAIILGDVYSNNWNGTIPANLATEDAGASAGYYLDTSTGSMQLEGDFFVGGDIDVTGTVTIASGTGTRLTVNGATDIAGVVTLDNGIKFSRAGSAFITTNDDPQNGDLYLTISESGNIARIFANEWSGGAELVRAELQITSDGFAIAQGELDLSGTGGISSSLGQDIDYTFPLGLAARLSNGTWELFDEGDLGVRLWTDSNISRLDFYDTSYSQIRKMEGTHLYIDNEVADQDIYIRTDNGGGAKNRLFIDGSADFIRFYDHDGTEAVQIQDPEQNIVTLADSDGHNAILFSFERAWRVSQGSSGASASMELYSTTNKLLDLGGDTNGAMAYFNSSSTGTSSVFAVNDALTNVGNHETMRVNRGSGSTMQYMGYYSSRAVDPDTGKTLKADLTPARIGAAAPLKRQGPDSFVLEWIDQIDPTFYRRTDTLEALGSVTGKSGWEFGFVLEDLAAVSPYLTTKPGEIVGHSPDELALIAVLWESNRDLRKRVAELERIVHVHHR